METNETHIAKIRVRYESNRQYIHLVTNCSEYRYNELIFESGIMFLEDLYPRGTASEFQYKFAAYDADFWVWWTAEWKAHENELICWLVECKVCLFTMGYYKEQMQQFMDQELELRYYEHYEKRRQHRWKFVPARVA